jgi:hypothetical protein
MGQYGNDTARRTLAGRRKESQKGSKSAREELATHRFSKTSLIGDGGRSEPELTTWLKANPREKWGGKRYLRESGEPGPSTQEELGAQKVKSPERKEKGERGERKEKRRRGDWEGVEVNKDWR